MNVERGGGRGGGGRGEGGEGRGRGGGWYLIQTHHIDLIEVQIKHKQNVCVF